MKIQVNDRHIGEYCLILFINPIHPRPRRYAQNNRQIILQLSLAIIKRHITRRKITLKRRQKNIQFPILDFIAQLVYLSSSHVHLQHKIPQTRHRLLHRRGLQQRRRLRQAVTNYRAYLLAKFTQNHRQANHGRYLIHAWMLTGRN